MTSAQSVGEGGVHIPLQMIVTSLTIMDALGPGIPGDE